MQKDTGKVVSITELDRLWMQVLAARSARIKSQKQETDLIDRFVREAKRVTGSALVILPADKHTGFTREDYCPCGAALVSGACPVEIEERALS